MFHEMALVREALATGTLPRGDVFAYTPTVSPVVHHEWLTGAVLYFVAVVTGLGGAGVRLLQVLLFAGTVLACYRCARLRGAGGAELAIFAPLVALVIGIGLTPVRAQMFTFLFVACLLLLLEQDRQGRRGWVGLWLAMYVVWLNLHGGVVAGVGLFGLHVAERFVRAAWSAGVRAAVRESWHLLAAGAALPVLALLNPYGADYLPYLWHAVLLDRPFIDEWAPLWDPRVHPALLGAYATMLAFLLYAVVRGGGPRRLPGLLLVAVAALMALRSQRLLPIYAIVWTAYVPAYLTRTPFAEPVRRAWRRYAAAVGAGALLAGLSFYVEAVRAQPWKLVVPTTGGLGSVYYPAGAVAYLSEVAFVGNLMTHFNVGAYVSWKLYPAVRVGMDSRYEVAYPPEAADENRRLYRAAPGWQAILARHGADAVLVPSWSPLDSLLAGERAGAAGGAWQEVYRDDGFAIFARTEVAELLPRVDRTGEALPAPFP